MKFLIRVFGMVFILMPILLLVAITAYWMSTVEILRIIGSCVFGAIAFWTPIIIGCYMLDRGSQ